MSLNVRGGAIMAFAVATFSLMDAGMKELSTAYPAVQIASMRCLASLPLILIWIGFRGGFRDVLKVRITLHLVRGAIGIFMLVAFVYGLRHLPLSETYAIFFVAPLLITAFAAWILGEHIEWQRWAAVAGGLVGVLIVLKPSGAGLITLAGLAVMLCAVGYALSAIIVRVAGRTDSTESMMFWVMTVMGVGATLLAIPQWRAIESRHWLVIAGIGITGCVAQWALTEAFRIAEASFLAPIEYTALAWGLVLDWLVWRTLPEARPLIGAAVIIVCGIYLIRRERSAPAAAPTLPSTPPP